MLQNGLMDYITYHAKVSLDLHSMNVVLSKRSMTLNKGKIFGGVKGKASTCTIFKYIFLFLTDIDWLHISGSSYKFVLDQVLTWNSASSYCERLGGHLVRLQTLAEYQTISDIINANFGKCLNI